MTTQKLRIVVMNGQKIIQALIVNDNLILTHLSHKSGNLNLTHLWLFH